MIARPRRPERAERARRRRLGGAMATVLLGRASGAPGRATCSFVTPRLVPPARRLAALRRAGGVAPWRRSPDPRVLAAFQDADGKKPSWRDAPVPPGGAQYPWHDFLTADNDDDDEPFWSFSEQQQPDGEGASGASGSLVQYGAAGGALTEKNRPPTLPKGQFRPKQSLGQNYLSDQNIASKIAGSVVDASPGGKCVVELGPGLGALTRVLHRRFPEMLAVEIDGRAVELLGDRYPSLSVVRGDVLEIDYTALAKLRGGRLNVVGNLPFYITSQILFTLADHHRSIERAVVTTQWEVAQRLVARPRTKPYGILAVVFQLYATPELLFKIPNTAFYPQPKVTSALVGITFPGPDRAPFPVDESKLRLVINTAFRQRRKMLRQSLKRILPRGFALGPEWATRRPEELAPPEFVRLTGAIFGERDDAALATARETDSGRPIWRTSGGINAMGDATPTPSSSSSQVGAA
mmetsp:Transcript_15058/g.60477  ORF Transcript_15058/g.60477 Transcript_15058/m.60477 type:complete len:465 (-) Transcript_15058:1582-2976(-)